MKEKFLELLRSTNREGIEDLIKFMEELKAEEERHIKASKLQCLTTDNGLSPP